MRSALQFCLGKEEYRERFFTYVPTKPSTWSMVTHLDSYLHLRYMTMMCDDKVQLELDWIIRQRDYVLDEKWNDSITSILKAIHVNCKF